LEVELELLSEREKRKVEESKRRDEKRRDEKRREEDQSLIL